MKKLSILAASALAVASAVGCTSQSKIQSARNDVFECEAAAFSKLLPAAIDASELVQRLYTGSAKLDSVLKNIQATAPELERLVGDLNSCRADLPSAEGEPDAGLPAGSAS